MLGEHVVRYPAVARRVVDEGHEVANHTYDHHVLLYYKPEELIQEILRTEDVIKNVTGATTKLFRPPKAWMTENEKRLVRDMGYEVVLWTLNSKDWVSFDDKYIIRYIVKNIRPGDIILFHDSGGTFSTEGGSRKDTVKTIPRLAEKLREKGYRFVTAGELLRMDRKEHHGK
jgi:peptidoglycan/xylan/chitin deacetylase (PgdA/CDA1 family)